MTEHATKPGVSLGPGFYEIGLLFMTACADLVWYPGSNGYFLGHMWWMTLHASLIIHVPGMGSSVAVETIRDVAMSFAVAIVAAQLGMTAPVSLQLPCRLGMTSSTVGQQLFYIETFKRCMGLLMTGLAREHVRRIPVRMVMATTALGKHVLVLQTSTKAVKGLMAVPAREPVGPFAVFNCHEDIIVTPGTVQWRHFFWHFLRCLAVDIVLLGTGRLCQRDYQQADK